MGVEDEDACRRAGSRRFESPAAHLDPFTRCALYERISV